MIRTRVLSTIAFFCYRVAVVGLATTPAVHSGAAEASPRVDLPNSAFPKEIRLAADQSIFALSAPKGIPGQGSEAGTPSSGVAAPSHRDVTFVVTSDVHYDAFENEDRNDRVRDTIRRMNAIMSVAWPEDIGGGLVAKPRGVLVLGDVIDDGDRILQGKHQTPRQYLLFCADFGLDGTDGLLDYPVYETWGNHDGPPIGKEKHDFSFQAQLKNRNLLRWKKGWLTGLAANGLHYSWDWDDVHFVLLGIYPADRQHPQVKYSAEWHDPQGALTFLKNDLAEHVGQSERPVVLASHCGFDTDWWHQEDWKALYEAIRPYNVILYLHGHTGTGLRPWAPAGEDKLLNCVNTGQTENGFFVVQITDDRIRLAYEAKNRLEQKTPEGKSKQVWDGTWQWKHLLHKQLDAMPAKQGVRFTPILPFSSLTFPSEPVTIPADSYLFWPSNFDLGRGIKLVWATAQATCEVDDRSERAVFEVFFATTPGTIMQPVAAAPQDADFEKAAVWHIRLPADLDLHADPILRLYYVGDVARAMNVQAHAKPEVAISIARRLQQQG